MTTNLDDFEALLADAETAGYDEGCFCASVANAVGTQKL